jgi:hypothetical protein
MQADTVASKSPKFMPANVSKDCEDLGKLGATDAVIRGASKVSELE